MKTYVRNQSVLPVLIAGLSLILAGHVMAQTFTTLHNFNGGDGADLHAGLILTGRTLYGATDGGGSSSGTVFAINTNGSSFANVHSFTGGNDGNGPDGTLLSSGTSLYGTVFSGGTNGNGAVFKVSTNGTGFQNLYSFAAVNGNNINSDGANPEVGLILSGNTLYGETTSGGSAGYGTVFKVNTDGSGFKNLYSFTNGSDGSIPEGLVISGNTLFGASLGISGNGTVFALNTNGTGFKVLHSFPATNFTPPSDGPAPPPGYTNNDGVGPTGLILSGSTLYGTAIWGGTNGNGTVFAINTNGTGFTTLHSFAATTGANYTNSEGTHPVAFNGLVSSGNSLYGTALFGGIEGSGTVFELNTNGTGFTTLHSFTATDVNGNNNDGANPYAGVTLSGKTLYGTAENGGTNGDGTVFSVSLELVVATTSLPNGTNGTAYNQTLAAFGGQTPYSWTNISGALPRGLTLATTGVISGIPTNGGTINFTVQVTDALSTTATQGFTITVIPMQVTTYSLPNGTNGFAYSQQLSAIYGQLPFSWSLISGSLPSGLTLVTDGLISGTPTTNGTFNFTVKVTDALSETATQALALTLFGPPSIAIQPTNSSVTAMVGSNVTFSVSVMGSGPFSYQWQLNGTNLPNGIITTVAGNGTGAYSGDGGAATNAGLAAPTGLAVDATGNLFISEPYNQRIRKLDPNGTIMTEAGSGTNGYSGDGGAATNAELSYPFSVALDATENLFIGDTDNNVIRKVGTNWLVTTVAGGGKSGLGDGGSATNAELSNPVGVALDASGNLFIADEGYSLVRKVGTNGIITTVAGNGTDGYSGDGGAATNASLAAPTGLAVDATGNLFISDRGNNRIRKLDTNGTITTVAGNGTNGYSGDGGAATNAELKSPFGVGVDATGNLFISDYGNNRIRKLDTNGTITTVAGNGTNGYSGDGGAATNAELDLPYDVAVDAHGNLFIADYYNNRIRKVVIQGPTLVFNAVVFGNGGAYDVVVSSPYGSVTSSVVNLTITLPPLILSSPQVTAGNTNFTFMLSGPAGSNYVLQVSTNLSNWNPVSTSTIPVSGSINLSNAISGSKPGFYRVHLQ